MRAAMFFAFDDFELDGERLELRRAGKPIRADAVVLRLLAVLLWNAGRLVTKDELVDTVWEGRAVADNVITVSMARLRKTLGHVRSQHEFVATVYGRGYRFVREVVERGERSGPTPAESGTSSEVEPPFVGRERVLERLQHALGESRAGRGRVCVLTGEPGIGKTRVVEALERQTSSPELRVAWGYCREAGGTPPLWPWLRLLREVMASYRASDLEQNIGAAASEVSRLLRQMDGAEPVGANELAAEQLGWEGPARYRCFEAVLRTFTFTAEQAPWLLVLDDLHRADAASLELLSLLLDEISHTRILVIATMRHGQDRRAARLESYLPQVLGHRNCERIALERLREEDVATYVAALLDDPDGGLGRAVFDKSEGNPFFMVELARQLGACEHPDPGSLSVPETAHELIRQRIAGLDQETRDMLSAAAVIGREFELPLLQAITGREPGALMASLDDALAADLVKAAPDSMTAFVFGHELLRAALCEMLSPAEQRDWHLRIGQALEERLNAGEAVLPSELAYHFHAALPRSDPRTTVHFCRAAANAAASVWANADVVRYARHALEALDLLEKPSLRLRVSLLFLISIHARGHDTTRFRQAIGEVVRLAREHRDGRMLTLAAIMLSPHPGFKPVSGTNTILERALVLLQPEDTGMRSVALAALACAAPHCYSAERAGALIAEAEALARHTGRPSPVHAALLCKLYLQGGPAQAREAVEVEDELERLARENAEQMAVLPADLAIHRAINALQRGEAAATMAAIERARVKCRELRNNELMWHNQRFRALVHVNSGTWSDGVALLDTLHRQAERRSIPGTEPFCAFDRVVIFSELSGTSTLDDALRSALEPEASDPPGIWALKVRALATAGLAAEARAALQAVSPPELAQVPCNSHWLGTLGHIARAALLLEAPVYAEAAYALLEPYPDLFAAHLSFLCEGSVPQLLGMLAHALGRHASAVAHLETGIQMNERAGFAPRAAEARLQLARCLLDMDQARIDQARTEQAGADQGSVELRQRALALARDAHSSAAGLGMQRLARDAHALQQRAQA